MSAYHLFIEGVASGPGVNAAQVAVAIGARFGIDANEISRRLTGGRFRVKSNVDYQTASSFRVELERLGVRCAILDATSGVAIESPAAPRPPAAKTPAVPAAANQAPYQSGLAAALGNGNQGDGGADALGALATGAFRLTALDNNDDEPPTGETEVDPDPNKQISATTFDVPATLLSEASLPSLASLAPSTPKSSGVVPAPAAPEPTFLPVTKPKPAGAPPPTTNEFGPPSQGQDEPSLTLLVDVRKERQLASQELAVARTMSQSIAAEQGAAAMRSARDFPSNEGRAGRASSPATSVAAAANSPIAMVLAPMPRWIIGVALALLLGFATAHAYAASKEATAFAAIDRRIHDQQAVVVTPTEWEALDGFRVLELAKKHAEKRAIAQSAALIWVLVSAALGLLWNLAVPWERLMQAQTRNRGDSV